MTRTEITQRLLLLAADMDELANETGERGFAWDTTALREAAKALKLEQETNRRILENYRPVVHGHWHEDSHGYSARCTVCGYSVDFDRMSPFCPQCGAKMDEEETGMTNRDVLMNALRGELDDGETMLYLLRCPYSWLHRLLGYQPAQPLCAYQDGMAADATCIECKRLWLDAEADTEVEA